ncbi:MAG: ferritin-like domain-containing protein, partial [Acidimicrobiales bacterium]
PARGRRTLMTDQMDIQDDLVPVAPPAPSRRKFFAIGGAIAAGVVVAACGSDDDEGGDGDKGGGDGDGDAGIATFGAGLELLAAQTYTAALDAATSGALGEVPPAVAEFATVAQAHHQAASDALAEAAGGITAEVDPDIKATVDAAFAEVTDVAGLARLALTLELQAAATYLEVLPALQSKAAIDLVGSIMPIERQHAAILHFALGEYPVPDVFATTDASLAPA